MTTLVIDVNSKKNVKISKRRKDNTKNILKTMCFYRYSTSKKTKEKGKYG